ncbi:hypothetical protein [Glycomyces sp. YM15]|uniref:hypothetical protein n=1 Tax=Glycomyces sp. YM15 TaxID=2800446 RepID=UPI001962E70F|nr:hypothetical protein [Glycomyces sp. YM15]
MKAPPHRLAGGRGGKNALEHELARLGVTQKNSRPKAAPGTDLQAPDPGRIRTDTIDKAGSVTMRHNGKLHHFGVGRIHEGTRVLLIVEGLDIRIIDTITGENLRQLTLDPTRDYQPTGKPKGPTRPA